MPNPTAADMIRALKLKPHPEGGHYAETYRSEAGLDGRAHATAIYYLLREGERSNWHRVDASEIWLWHAGAPLELRIGGETVTLGPDLAGGARPQAIVPPQAAISTSVANNPRSVSTRRATPGLLIFWERIFFMLNADGM